MKYREAVVRAALEAPILVGELIVKICMIFGAYYFASWLWSTRVFQPVLQAYGESLPVVVIFPLALSPMLVGLIAVFWANRLLKEDRLGFTAFKHGSR